MRSLLLCIFLGLATHTLAQNTSVPATEATALDGHVVHLPADLRAPTVLVLGFSKKASEQTMVWERAVRGPLSGPPATPTFVAAMLAAVPGFVRSFVVRSMRKEIPEGLQANFLTLTDNEAGWKRVADFAPDAPDAAYILLLDRRGRVVWQTHEAFSQAALDRLRAGEKSLAPAATP